MLIIIILKKWKETKESLKESRITFRSQKLEQ